MCGECKFCDSVGCTICSRKRINELEILLMDIHTDLLMRSEKDFYGNNVVNLSGSIWHELKETIKLI